MNKWTKNTQHYFEEMNQREGLPLPDIKTYQKAIVSSKKWYWFKDKQTNGTEEKVQTYVYIETLYMIELQLQQEKDKCFDKQCRAVGQQQRKQ